MRNTWFGNGNKAYAWDKTSLFSHKPPTRKKDFLEEKYSIGWQGMLPLTQTETRSRSPIDRHRHSSSSGRALDPSLQDIPTVQSKKKHLTLSIPEHQGPSVKKSFQLNDKLVQKNLPSLANPLLSPSIVHTYSSRHALTPTPGDRDVSNKRRFSKGESERKGNLNADGSESLWRSEKIKPEFVSQIPGLGGTIKAESPKQNKPDIERYRAKGLLRTEPAPERTGKQKSLTGNEQWRSSLDIIKHVITKKK